MMKRFLGSKAAARLVSFLLAFSLLFCQLPGAVWADELPAADGEVLAAEGGGADDSSAAAAADAAADTEAAEDTTAAEDTVDTDTATADAATGGEPEQTYPNAAPEAAAAAELSDVLPAAETAPAMTDTEAVAAVYAEFSDSKTYGNASKTPLVFPLEYEGTTYTNVIEYLKTWALQNTGRELAVSCEVYPGSPATYNDWRSGTLVKQPYELKIDDDSNITQDYYKNNDPKIMGALKNVTFSVGEETSQAIKNVYIKVNSLQRSPQEVVDYVAANLPFERIRNGNASADAIVQALGEKSASSTALPTSNDFYSTTLVKVTWNLQPVSGSSDALKLSGNKTTVSRPNVGEEPAVFDLFATAAYKTDDTVTADSETTRLTVPAFAGVTVPIQVTEGAVLTLTDDYYKAAVDGKYIEQQDSAPAGYDLYNCTLHTSATGTAQSFKYTATKAGHITQSGTFKVTDDGMATLVIDLPASSEADTKLAGLTLTAPGEGSADIVTGLAFDPDTYEYNIEVKGVQSVSFAGEAAVNGAKAQITSYYSSLSNANKGTLTTSGKALTTKCYLPDAVSDSTIIITVTAPEGSTLAEKTRTYTIHVKKSAASGPLTGLAVTAQSAGAAAKVNNALDEGLPLEEKLAPAFVAGTTSLGVYTVNYYRDQITVKPTAAGCDITVNGQTVQSGKASTPVDLQVGSNTIPINVTKDGVTTAYELTVYRKAELVIKDITLPEGFLGAAMPTGGSEWTGTVSVYADTDKAHLTVNTNLTDQSGVDVKIKAGDLVVTGKAGQPLEIPTGGKDSLMTYIYLSQTVDGVHEGQGYVVSLNRMPDSAPSAVESYLPAPGQFVNLDSYNAPGKTLSGQQAVTLGAFGGNIVYRFDNPVANDPHNPYGIDFIVEGNAFANSDGSSSLTAAEPAAVMVSPDGETWYELAGSEYYTASTVHDLTVNYTNGDTTFTAAAATAWTDSEGGSGVMPVVADHKQPYFPDPAWYSAFQTGVGANASYTADTVSFTGSMIDKTVYPAFGYADTHFYNKGNSATNPYIASHLMGCNGDGFDLAWAVDANGDPVQLDAVQYVKIYNAKLAYGSAKGEASPEIKSVQRAKPVTSEVGTSSGLTALSVNGKSVTLQDGVYTYNIDGEGAGTLRITPTAANAGANIYVSNQRVASGETSGSLTAVNKTRLIVQEDEKQPVIYILNFTNVQTAASNAELTALKLTPGDLVQNPNAQDEIRFAVDNIVAAVRLTPAVSSSKTAVTLSGGSLTEPIALVNGQVGAAVPLAVGENSLTLTVTSADKSNTKAYTVLITRAAASSSGGTHDNTISVKFYLTGDTLHYDAAANSYTGKHSDPVWIAKKTVKVPAGSTIKYLTELMLNNAGIDYVSDGEYVSAIKGLAEFDNGPNSGWMYRHNTLIANEGYAARELADGDEVQWFYTDDYTKENDYEDWDDGGSAAVTKAEQTPEEVTAPKADANGFTDVGSHWGAKAIDFVVKEKLFNGTTITTFEPDTAMSRAMLVTVLWRLAGQPKTDAAIGFADVAGGAYYAEAVKWASVNGIVKGYSDVLFGSNDNVTREQLAAILYRYAEFKGFDVSKTAELDKFTDAAAVSAYAADALKWAAAAEIVNGKENNNLDPAGKATRAEVAMMVMRFCQGVQK